MHDPDTRAQSLGLAQQGSQVWYCRLLRDGLAAPSSQWRQAAGLTPGLGLGLELEPEQALVLGLVPGAGPSAQAAALQRLVAVQTTTSSI